MSFICLKRKENYLNCCFLKGETKFESLEEKDEFLNLVGILQLAVDLPTKTTQVITIR